jgi:hypothetical protein
MAWFHLNLRISEKEGREGYCGPIEAAGAGGVVGWKELLRRRAELCSLRSPSDPWYRSYKIGL